MFIDTYRFVLNNIKKPNIDDNGIRNDKYEYSFNDRGF